MTVSYIAWVPLCWGMVESRAALPSLLPLLILSVRSLCSLGRIYRDLGDGGNVPVGPERIEQRTLVGHTAVDLGTSKYDIRTGGLSFANKKNTLLNINDCARG